MTHIVTENSIHNNQSSTIDFDNWLNNHSDIKHQFRSNVFEIAGKLYSAPENVPKRLTDSNGLLNECMQQAEKQIIAKYRALYKQGQEAPAV